jgi:hypothetical protein
MSNHFKLLPTGISSFPSTNPCQASLVKASRGIPICLPFLISAWCFSSCNSAVNQKRINVAPRKDAIVSLTLHGRRKDLDDLNVSWSSLHLIPNRDSQVMDRSLKITSLSITRSDHNSALTYLGCTIIRTSTHGDQSQPTRHEDESRLFLLRLEERGIVLEKSNPGEVIGVHLQIDRVQVEGSRIGEIRLALNSRVHDDTVEIGVFSRRPIQSASRVMSSTPISAIQYRKEARLTFVQTLRSP